MAEEYTFESFDGTELYGKTDYADEPQGAVVIVHGLCEHQGRYDYLTARLVAEGYSVYRFDHRGHGRSKGTKVFYSAFDEIAKDTDVVVERALAENEGLPVYMLGHSMGGYGAALYGHLFPGKIQGYVLSGAWTRDNGGLGANAIKATEGQPDLTYLPNQLGDGVCSNPAVGERYMADPLVAKEMSVGLFRALSKGHEYMREHAKDFVDPVLIMHGAADGLVSPKDSMELFESIGTSNDEKSLRIYEGLMHEIFNEYAKDMVIEDALDWLNAHTMAYDWDNEDEE